MGIQGIDLLTPSETLKIKGHSLVCPVSTFPQDENGLGCSEKAFNKPEHHAPLLELYQKWIPEAAEAGISNVIVFSGNRDGLSDQEGLENCASGLEPLLALAEKPNSRASWPKNSSRLGPIKKQLSLTLSNAALRSRFRKSGPT